MININNITRHDFDAAITMLATIRDHALAAELDIRADDSLCDFTDALSMILDTDESFSPDALDAMMNFISNIDH